MTRITGNQKRGIARLTNKITMSLLLARLRSLAHGFVQRVGGNSIAWPVTDSQPFCGARFASRELRPFDRNASEHAEGRPRVSNRVPCFEPILRHSEIDAGDEPPRWRPPGKLNQGM